MAAVAPVPSDSRGAPDRVVPPEQRDRIVVALFSGDKDMMGDVFYGSVAARADATIEQWKYQQRSDKREDT